jgi:hypothetical protein
MWGLYYNDSWLSPLKSRHKKGERVKIKYDPMDISLIHVYDCESNWYLPVPAVDQNYTNGLTLWQHKVIKREARLSAEDYVDIEQLSLAKDRIQKMVDKQFNAQSKSGSNVKAALWQNIDGKPGGRVEVSEPPPNEQAQGRNDFDDFTRFQPEGGAPFGESQPSPAEVLEIDGTQNASTGATPRSQVVELGITKSSSSQKPKRHRQHEGNDSDSALRAPTDLPTLSEHTNISFEDEDELDLTEFNSSYELPGRK